MHSFKIRMCAFKIKQCINFLEFVYIIKYTTHLLKPKSITIVQWYKYLKNAKRLLMLIKIKENDFKEYLKGKKG